MGPDSLQPKIPDATFFTPTERGQETKESEKLQEIGPPTLFHTTAFQQPLESPGSAKIPQASKAEGSEGGSLRTKAKLVFQKSFGVERSQEDITEKFTENEKTAYSKLDADQKTKFAKLSPKEQKIACELFDGLNIENTIKFITLEPEQRSLIIKSSRKMNPKEYFVGSEKKENQHDKHIDTIRGLLNLVSLVSNDPDKAKKFIDLNNIEKLKDLNEQELNELFLLTQNIKVTTEGNPTTNYLNTTKEDRDRYRKNNPTTEKNQSNFIMQYHMSPERARLVDELTPLKAEIDKQPIDRNAINSLVANFIIRHKNDSNALLAYETLGVLLNRQASKLEIKEKLIILPLSTSTTNPDGTLTSRPEEPKEQEKRMFLWLEKFSSKS